MKPQSTTFIDIDSGNPIGEPLENILVPTFLGMIVEDHVGVRYTIQGAELLDSMDSLRLIVDVKRLPS